MHSADDWHDVLVPEIERQQAEGNRVAFRADAAFAKPEICDALEQRDVDYAIRMPANKSLELEIEDIRFRPPGRPSCKSSRSSSRAASSSRTCGHCRRSTRSTLSSSPLLLVHRRRDEITHALM